jgi:hypothetical protein
MALTPEQVASIVATIRRRRAHDAPFGLALTAVSAAGDASIAGEYADARVTWLEHLHGFWADYRALLARV